MEIQKELPDRNTTFEYDESQNFPEAVPKEDLPEVNEDHVYPEVCQGCHRHEQGLEPVQRKEPRICGIRKKTWWIGLFAIVAVIIVTLLGVSIGVIENRNNSSKQRTASAPTSTSGSTPSSTSTPNSVANGTETSSAGRVASFSRLAAANYTDRQDQTYFQVYYQDDNLDLWLGNLNVNSSDPTWSFSMVNATSLNPKNGTPIVAMNWVDPDTSDGTRTDFHLRFISEPDNYIRAIYSRYGEYEDGWAEAGSPDGAWEVSSNSSLAGHMKDCAECLDLEDMVFWSPTVDQTANAFPRITPTFESFTPNGTVIEEGTSYAMISMFGIASLNETTNFVAMYVNVEGRLRELYYPKYTSWGYTGMNVSLTIPAEAQIAAMSYLYDDERYAQVLITRSDGGVDIAYLDGSAWFSANSLAGFENVIPFSPIAATQAGRAYALEQGDDGPEIVEFERTSTTGLPTFERLGVVNTTAAASETAA